MCIRDRIRTYIEKADEALAALGYTEHSYAHVTRVAHFAEKILADLGYPRRMQELAWIAGYMHDIGNVINLSLIHISINTKKLHMFDPETELAILN